jgi:hypothetical protein
LTCIVCAKLSELPSSSDTPACALLML